MQKTADPKIFGLDTENKTFLMKPFIHLLENMSGLGRLQQKYNELKPDEEPEKFLEQSLGYLKVGYVIADNGTDKIPTSGGVIVVANHPFGALDGMVLARLLLAIRPDVRILANHVLLRIPGMRELIFACDPFGKDRKLNHTSLRQSIRWLQNGGLLLVFPAGEVSHYQIAKGKVTDPCWHDTVARLVVLTGVPVVPIYIHGRNSVAFQIAGYLHSWLRTLMLPGELLRHAGQQVRLRVGQLIPSGKLKRLGTEKSITNYLRLCTYLLAEVNDRSPGVVTPVARAGGHLPIVSQTPRELQKSEIKYLPAEQLLLRTGNMEVYYARATRIPWLLQEIGRLREITFRQTGEGTGKATDIDLYDSWYLHLFVWNTEQEEIVGAYRLGLVDEILRKYGKRGLYTHSLFKYKNSVLRELGSAVELGRSFIRQEYQCSYLALNLLWQGIGIWVARQRRYPILFGPVSISNDYDYLSRKFMIDALRFNLSESRLAADVKPRKPFRNHGHKYWHNADLALFNDAGLISDFVSRMERDNKGIPVLVRQYLKLGGRFLCFNVDEDFSAVVDGLIMVDLRKSPVKALEKYMGRDHAAAFLAYHQIDTEPLKEVS